MDQWRFHMTLTGPVNREQAEMMAGFLNDWFREALREPLWVEDLCVFIETEVGGEFRLGARFPLARTA